MRQLLAPPRLVPQLLQSFEVSIQDATLQVTPPLPVVLKSPSPSPLAVFSSQVETLPPQSMIGFPSTQNEAFLPTPPFGSARLRLPLLPLMTVSFLWSLSPT
ncbi:unnamed protein product [Arabidopsis halleri]